MSACRRWNKKSTIAQLKAQFKAQLSTVHCQHKQMQGESAETSGYHAANAAVGQTQDQMSEATIGALDNLATTPTTDRRVLATLTEDNA
jgi:hypothetical protein